MPKERKESDVIMGWSPRPSRTSSGATKTSDRNVIFALAKA